MNAQDIDDQKTLEFSQAIEWFTHRRLGGWLQEPREFPKPSPEMQLQVIAAMLERLATIDLPAPFAGPWADGCAELLEIAEDLRRTLEWAGAE